SCASTRWTPTTQPCGGFRTRSCPPGRIVTGRIVPGLQTGLLAVEQRVGFRCVISMSDPIEDVTLHALDEYVDHNNHLGRLERDILLRWHVVAPEGQEPDLTWRRTAYRCRVRPRLPTLFV